MTDNTRHPGNESSGNSEAKGQLGEVLKLCWQLGDGIEVFFPGGVTALRRQRGEQLKYRQWVWRHARSNRGAEGNWVPGSAFRTAVEDLQPAPPSNGGIRNYDGVLPFDEIVRWCRTRGENIQVGHEHGRADLERMSLDALRAKQWKWRDPRTNKGTILKHHWFSGPTFLALTAGRFEST